MNDKVAANGRTPVAVKARSLQAEEASLCISGGGLLKLREDVQSCGYQDVHVMWELLRRSEIEFRAALHFPHVPAQQQTSLESFLLDI
ncbi:hypothetical protein SAY86_028355 [Trapa natans]|uniref:Uncharacterized protein n=1 Tax=Trapa natans TaxID=22666 RepID=A0AAN7M0I2_TRANT|nr:hypothetical protein SAY86_028355 [Trapa natans]